ncbi:histone deacetylase 11-like isoform X2 [Acanthaster planci]|uniref:Histone deacetylase 11 n=1 Tax=Acanthaster planci TaxID=133434 RepID=A0A8B7ZEG8_ACAPL|nr:histone deacetylase 11-like isoform X2 [Acanthaster planci]
MASCVGESPQDKASVGGGNCSHACESFPHDSEKPQGIADIEKPSDDQSQQQSQPGDQTVPEHQSQPHRTKLFVRVEDKQWPIVYSPDYNIGFLGLEKLHPFDSGKWGKVFNFLKEKGMLSDETIIRPSEATTEDLLVVHTKKYLDSLRWSVTVATITEVPPVALLPNVVVQRKVLKPLRTQTGGTILAGKLAMERGWAINIGGGFHHCSSDRGGGFCAYADITLAIKFLLQLGMVKKVMIIDLDAHQGNGHERDFMNMQDTVYILDMYNRSIYPHDGYAKRGIRQKVELDFFTDDGPFLRAVDKYFKKALEEFLPDLIVYNAGTDILEGDPLGALSISPEGIIQRDQLVFEIARRRERPIPLLMVTSGGYQRNNASIIADSILNLRRLKLIECPQAEEHLKAQVQPASRESDVDTGAANANPTGTRSWRSWFSFKK